MKQENCIYYNNGDCKKGLPGTKCKVVGCVAWISKPDKTYPLSVVTDLLGKTEQSPAVLTPGLTWQDIKTIVEIADKMVSEDPNEHSDWLETEEGYYKAILEEFNKTRK